MRSFGSLSASLVLVLCACSAAVAEDSEVKKSGAKPLDCQLTYTLKGWSAFYKTAKGEGTVKCDNGQTADVTIRTKGGGLTFGKSEIVDGLGQFSKLYDIEEAFGTYAAGGAHAGAVKSQEATAMTKGEVSLVLTGTGRGFDLGVDVSKFVIKRK